MTDKNAELGKPEKLMISVPIVYQAGGFHYHFFKLLVFTGKLLSDSKLQNNYPPAL